MDDSGNDGRQCADLIVSDMDRWQDFFQLADWLRGPVPTSATLTDEAVLFDVNPALSFASRPVHAVCRQTVEHLPPYRITVNIFGLYGVTSPLPGHYIEDVLHGGEDSPLRRFLDIFNHRLIALYHNAWSAHRHYSRSTRGSHFMCRRLLALAGIADAATAAVPVELQIERLQAVAGLLTLRRPSRLALQRLLCTYFLLPRVRIEENIAGWLRIHEQQRTHLGRSNTRLAQDFILGEYVREQQLKFRIVFSGLDRATFRHFLPATEGYYALRRLLRLAVNRPLQFQLRLELAAGQAPALQLAAAGDLRLGLDTWLGDPGDMACLQMESG